RLTALVYARNARNDWLSRLRERALVRSLPAARDACVLTLTGHGTFVDERSPVREVLRSAYEIRVMLVNPVGEGVRRRVESLPPEVTVLSFHGEIEASIQLGYRDAAGYETGRAPLGVPISSIGTPARHGLTTIDGHNQARLRGHQ